MDIEKTLEYLDGEYLSAFEKSGSVNSAIPLQQPFVKTKEVKAFYPAGADEDLAAKTYHELDIVCGDARDAKTSLALRLLETVLLEGNSAPLRLALLESGISITNTVLAQKCPEFLDFYRRKNSGSDSITLAPDEVQAEAPETPQETFDRVYAIINEQLADDLLAEVLNQTPAFFEQLVVDLMKAMNYGEGFVTKYSGDDGIDGIIHEDQLGFNLIYIQAKRWKPDVTIGKPELQKFAGAMMGPPRVEKGLFITTAKFSPKARDFANAQHIILVDGKRLTELMIEYGVGVSTQKAYLIKRVDSDYFSDN